MKNPLILVALPGAGVGLLGLLYLPSRKIILGLMILLVVGMVASNIRERKSCREILVQIALVLPVLVAGLFYRFVGDLVFSFVLLFFCAMFFLGFSETPKSTHKLWAMYSTVIGALVLACWLNRSTILELVTASR